MLILELGFPHGRCYAAQTDEPDRPEWPPHPSRLFSALVAAAHLSQPGLTEDRLKALEWLERQPPPLIDAPVADTDAMPISYVPPGDRNVQAGKDEHPVYRIRKDRHFPMAYILSEPVIRYAWAEEPNQDQLTTLDQLTTSMTHLGTSHSMVLARAYLGQIDQPSHLPNTLGGEFLRVPVAGRLDELIELHQRTDPLVRRPPSGLEPIAAFRNRLRSRSTARPAPFRELQILRLPGLTHSLESTETLARALRRAVMSRLEDPIPAPIHGHEDGPHVGWWPLGDVGHTHAWGRVLGIALALPEALTEADTERLFIALGQVQHHGMRLDDGRDLFPTPLSLEQTPPLALKADTWTRPARVWASVTPVVPDRLPKRPREDQVIRAIADSLLRAGHPNPEQIEPSSHSHFAGAPSAREFASRLPRWHARITFAEPICGPVCAGRLRYFGVGLFRPLEKSA